jgi:hypothetical protein
VNILDFANTDRERLILQLKAQGITAPEVALKAGITERNVFRTIARVKARAAARGYAPDSDWIHTVPKGQQVAGVSSLYRDGQDQPVLQWVKSKTDQEAAYELILDSLENAHENYKPFKPSKSKGKKKENLASLLTITDFHLGMYAYEAETGDNWDSEIAERVFLDSIAAMIEAAPPSKVGILCQLGDFLHWDGILSASTPMSGHALDADTRYSKLVELCMYVMTEAVRMMLEKFEQVVVISAEGNHDISGSIWLRKHIKHIYSKDKRVEVIDNDYPYYAYLHGEIMLGFHHGHKMKLASLHKLFASEPRFRSMWGKSVAAYIHTGHYHHERVIEDGGAIAEQHPTLSGRDAYAARGGYVSLRGAKLITYDKHDGEISRITIRPET